MYVRYQTITYEANLSNGVTLFIPGIEVEFWKIEGREEECFSGEQCRKIEETIKHLFPDYFRA